MAINDLRPPSRERLKELSFSDTMLNDGRENALWFVEVIWGKLIDSMRHLTTLAEANKYS